MISVRTYYVKINVPDGQLVLIELVKFEVRLVDETSHGWDALFMREQLCYMREAENYIDRRSPLPLADCTAVPIIVCKCVFADTEDSNLKSTEKGLCSLPRRNL